jgi:beta-apo-4'-carotenal oxygenase
MLDDSRGKILMGGQVDESQNYIDITVVQVDDEKDSMIVDESFGPLIPLLAVDSIEDAIRIANSVDSTPLGLYPFGTKAETDKSTSLHFNPDFIISYTVVTELTPSNTHNA